MAKALLLLSAALFAAFGAALAARPEILADFVGITATTAGGLTELRAFYGGLELGLALFLVLCAARPAWRAAGCIGLACINGGIAATRIYGMLVDGSVSSMLLSFLAVEIVLCGLGIVAARK